MRFKCHLPNEARIDTENIIWYSALLQAGSKMIMMAPTTVCFQ